MSETRAKGYLVAALVWCLIVIMLGIAYRFLVQPYLREKLKGDTSSTSRYRDEVVVALDSFSGYAVLRSEPLRQELQEQQVKVTLVDDHADYQARIKALRDGKMQLAAFTIDSLITASVRLGEFPATIVLVLDETKGGDAMVARKSQVANLQALDRPDARIVFTANSPSEFFSRVVLAQFRLPNLPEQWGVRSDTVESVYQQLLSSRAPEKKAFVLWEPYVSRALEDSDVHVLLDTSRLNGYIVDVLVAQRQFLRDHPEKVRQFIEAYLRAAYSFSQQPDGFVQLVRNDSDKSGAARLNENQAKQVVQGIRWKNTLENYAHFGLIPGGGDARLLHVEDMIGNIIDVLIRTHALTADPLEGKRNSLFYQQALVELQQEKFHPGKGTPSASGELEAARIDVATKPLSSDEWARLLPVGQLRVEPIVFVRGSANISLESERDLQALAHRLESLPQLYLRVVGHTRAEGDPEANRALAEARSEAASRFLRTQGVSGDRIRTEAAPATAQSEEAQAVSFFVGQLPY